MKEKEKDKTTEKIDSQNNTNKDEINETNKIIKNEKNEKNIVLRENEKDLETKDIFIIENENNDSFIKEEILKDKDKKNNKNLQEEKILKDEDNKNHQEEENILIKENENEFSETKIKIKGKKQKKKFKMPSSLTIIIGVLFATIVFTWIASLISSDVTSAGFFSFGTAIGAGFGDASSLIFYLLVLGGVIELMLVSGALESGVSSLVKVFKGKELLLIPLLLTMFSAGGTIYGMQEETIGLYIIIVPTLALAGFDTVTGLMVILLGTTVGFAVSTINPFSIGAAVDAAAMDGFTIGTGLIFRIVWWVILTLIAIAFVTTYAWYVKKNPEKSINKSNKEEADEWLKSFSTSNQKNATKREKWALAVFMLAFLIMVVMFIPWPDLFHFSWEDVKLPKWLAPIFGIFFNGVNKPGEWYFNDLSMLFIVAGAIIVLILGMGMKKSSTAIWDGSKGMLSVAIIIGVARSIPIILSETGTQNWLINGMSSKLAGMSQLGFVYAMFFVFLVLGIAIPSTSGLAAATMGTISSLVVTIGGPDGQIGLMAAVLMVFVLATGIVNMFSPTQAIVMVSCESAHVSYLDSMKPIGTFAGITTVITLVAIIPSTLMLLN